MMLKDSCDSAHKKERGEFSLPFSLKQKYAILPKKEDRICR